MEVSFYSDCIVKASLLTFFILLLISLVFFTLAQYNYFGQKAVHMKKENTAVFVTAHPDDECMFFSPSLLLLVKENPKNVHVLCLTTGNFYKKGGERQKELHASCQVLGIPANNVAIFDNSSFQDGHSEWDNNALLPAMLNYMERIKPDYIFTFDRYGVSGHVNHIAASKAVRLLYKDLKQKQSIPAIFELESVPIYRKYTSFLDIPVSLATGQVVFISSLADIWKAQRAMCAHSSQLVWFRFLYIAFSRYMLINTYREVDVNQPL